MAQIGTGDPRWIVKDRADGANVNAWHWTEKNITGWAHDRFKEIVERRAYDLSPAANAAATKVKVNEISGDCGLMNRKKKLVYYFQVTFKLGWTVEIDGEKVTGTLAVHEVDQDEDEDDYDYSFGVGGTVKPACTEAVAHAKKHGLRYVGTVLTEFKAVIKEFMNKGGDLSSPRGGAGAAAELEDDFADVDDAAIPAEAVFPPAPTSAPRGVKPTARPYEATITKTTTNEPMGTELDPDTLELLRVHEGTAGYASAARHCAGLRLVAINATPVKTMDDVRGLAKANTKLTLTLVDLDLENARWEPSVVLNDRLLDDAKALHGDVPLPDALKSTMFSNRAWGRINKNREGYKSNIVTNAAWEDAKLACSCANTPDALAVKGWVAFEAAKISAAEADRAKFYKEALACAAELCRRADGVSRGTNLLDAVLASIASFQNFSAYVPLAALLEQDDAALLVGARLHSLLAATTDVTFLKLGYGRQVRKACRAHKLLPLQALAKQIGIKIRPAPQPEA